MRFVTLLGWINFFSLPNRPNIVVLLFMEFLSITGVYLVDGGDDLPTKSVWRSLCHAGLVFYAIWYPGAFLRPDST